MNSFRVSAHSLSFKMFRILSRSALLVSMVLPLVPLVRANTAFVRVNQLGYEAGTLSRAYLMSKTSEAGAVFRVLDSNGQAKFSASIGADLGKWGKFTVYALDFRVSESGSYTIEVDGPDSATSLRFRIDDPEDLYSHALRNGLNFYQNERDGSDFIRTPLRSAAGHLNDQYGSVFQSPQFDSNDLILGDLKHTGTSIDATGGWWDAGDYLKFVQTHSYAVALMLIGIRDFPEQMGVRAGSSDFRDEAKFGLDWLLKMWDADSETLYYQVGIGTDFLSNPNLLSDHDLWRLPQDDDKSGGSDPSLVYVRHRPVFVAGPAGAKISPNLSGRLAAAFAGCYQVFRESHPDFADRCLVAGERVLDLADTSPSGDLLTVAPFDFYGETEWRDDLELGATELYFALASAERPLPSTLRHTDPTHYLRAAAQWAHAYITGPNDAADTLNLYDVSGLAHFELFRAISSAGHPAELEVSQFDLLNDLRKQLESAVSQSTSDPFGFGFPWDSYDSATHGAGLSVEAREYAFLTGSSTFDSYSRRWSANILGANAWGSSFIVGDGEVFPHCMQHQVANIVGSLDGTPPILLGALVEGPNSFAATGFLDGMKVCPPSHGDIFKQFNGNGAIFKDEQESFSTVEPAIDLTAASFLMFSWRTAGAPAAWVPNDDISPALEQAIDPAIITKRNPQWPPRRHARHLSRPAAAPSNP
jgi:endoglucanase